MADSTDSGPMIRSRRSLHHEKNAETDKQVQQNCRKCGKTLNCHNPRKDETEDESLAKELEKKSAKPDELHLSENENSLCEDCAQFDINQLHSIEVKRNLIPTFAGNWKYLLVIVIILGFATSSFVHFKSTEKRFDINIFNQTEEEIYFDNELDGIEDTYTHQDKRVWSTFAGGVKSVTAEKNNNKPSVFLLLFDNDGAEKTAKCLAVDVVGVASKYLMKQKTKLLLHGGAELNQAEFLEDPGRMLVYFKRPVEESGAMIVTNLQDVNPKVAASFHFFCDRFSPLVDKAIYFFTLKVPSFPKYSGKKLQEIAEDELNKLWSKHLPENKLHPLITRLTGHVLRIVEDYNGC